MAIMTGAGVSPVETTRHKQVAVTFYGELINCGGKWIWIDPLPYSMDTIYNLERGHAAWELCIRSIGFGRQDMDCLHNKGSKATASEHCEMRIHDDIVGRQYNLLRWMVYDQ